MQNAFNTEEMRSFSRKPVTGNVECLLGKGIRVTGTILDFSEAGIGIETDYPLAPGYTLTMKNWLGEYAGVVKWAIPLGDATHRAGLMFEATGADALSASIDRFVADLEEIEQNCLLPADDRDEAMRLTSQAIMNMKKATELFEKKNDSETIREAQLRFREKTDPIFLKSYLMNRARTWPQGYPGDYKTLEAVYKNTPRSTGIGSCLDRHFLSTELAVAVRGRKETLKQLLLEELQKKSNAKILDIACGSCRELQEISSDIEDNDAQMTCIDFDGDSLAFSADRLTSAGASIERYVFRKYNALKMISHARNLKEFGMQDVIYSTGLYDYLESDLLVRMFRALYQLLNPGGTMIISFKDRRRYSTFDYHWLVDWSAFFQREESDFRKILEDAGIDAAAVRTTREESGVVLFYTVSRK